MLALSTDFSLLFFSNKFSGIECFISIDTILIIIIIWSNVIGMQFLIPTQRMKQYFYSVTIGAFVNLLLVYPFILILHDIGVVYATIIAEVAVTSYQFYTVRKHLDIQQMLLDSSKILIAAIIMFMTLLYVNQLLSFSIWHFMLKIVVGVIIYILLILILFFKTLKRYILNNYASS
ncbi:polysaccharide biosynthesis C-terminal domain-containing protein [Weissella paramesenteroides]